MAIHSFGTLLHHPTIAIPERSPFGDTPCRTGRGLVLIRHATSVNSSWHIHNSPQFADPAVQPDPLDVSSHVLHPYNSNRKVCGCKLRSRRQNLPNVAFLSIKHRKITRGIRRSAAVESHQSSPTLQYTQITTHATTYVSWPRFRRSNGIDSLPDADAIYGSASSTRTSNSSTAGPYIHRVTGSPLLVRF